MDQVAALHWLQENIAEFGGQPNNVTIIGHGYGAACAHLLMISPMARGYTKTLILILKIKISNVALHLYFELANQCCLSICSIKPRTN